MLFRRFNFIKSMKYKIVSTLIFNNNKIFIRINFVKKTFLEMLGTILVKMSKNQVCPKISKYLNGLIDMNPCILRWKPFSRTY